jgi:hypothetical protein
MTVLAEHEGALVEERLLVVEKDFWDDEIVVWLEDVVESIFELELELELKLEVDDILYDDELLVRTRDVESLFELGLELDEVLTDDVVLELDET